MSIELKNVSVDYIDVGDVTKDGAVHALRDVSLSVARGESLAIIGPSGCGKSTLLKVMCGLVRPSAGEVVYGGSDDVHYGFLSQTDTNVCSPDGMRTTSKAHRPATAFIQQNYGLLPWFSVQKNVELGLMVQRTPKRGRPQRLSKNGMVRRIPEYERPQRVSRRERVQRVKEALETVGLQDFARAHPNQLSGGMQQRVAIARAIAMNAQLLLMDEPLSALDPALREELQDVLLQFWAERAYTQVIVTHSIEEAVYLGQRILVITQQPGRISAVIDNSDASYFARLREDTTVSLQDFTNSDAVHFTRLREGEGAMVASEFRKSEEFFERCRQVYMVFKEAMEADFEKGVEQ